MANPLFKKGATGWERVIVLPIFPVWQGAFAVLLAVIFVNLRIDSLRMGLTGIPVDALVGGGSLLIMALLLNLAPQKYIKDAE